MMSKLVSHKSSSLSVNVPIRSARIFICFKDSSPEMYNTFLSMWERFLHICNSSVDFPIPGSPPTSTSEPATMPPPSTLSSSLIPVDIRSVSLVLISASFDGSLFPSDTICTGAPLPFAVFVFATGSSDAVFHSRHAGHCPNHFADSYPHSLQKNAVSLAFAIFPSHLL